MARIFNDGTERNDKRTKEGEFPGKPSMIQKVNNEQYGKIRVNLVELLSILYVSDRGAKGTITAYFPGLTFQNLLSS